MNVFKLLLKGIYSPKDIAKARFTGIGKAILFIFILSIIAAVPQGYHMSQEISNAMSGFQHVIKKDLPDFSIEKGKLQADQSEPIEKEENGITIIFDPAEKIKASELESKQTAIALLKEKAVIAIDGQMTDIPYQLLGGTLTKDELARVTNQNQAIIITVICVLLYLSTAALMFISATFLAMLGTFIKRMQQKELSFQMLWKLSAYSLTLTTVFFAIMSALNTPVANSFLLNWVINFIFLYLVVKEIPAKHKPLAKN
ncbi:DUF1189 domain-containing protein [Bacillus pumilus]|uniref:DUF1189 domain-containing protein n=1 Tax=Bacillus pumilus TaxID=1408 RepID=UPI000717670F|nr:DUF1189 domain-containing protein [Bacillus pumilus]KRU16178.1 hypothetical protein AS142_10015 [Bacillus pumilus]